MEIAERTDSTNRLAGAEPERTGRFRIPGDQIAKATAEYSDECRVALRWLADYGRANNLSYDQLAAKLRKKNGEPYSGQSVYSILTGHWDEKHLGPVIEEIQRFRRVSEERQGLAETGFVETGLSRRIFRCCERAFLRKKLTFIFGESQIGKTTALEEYARRARDFNAVYVRVPARGSIGDLYHEFAITLGIPAQQPYRQLRSRILSYFDDRVLLLVDECHQCMAGAYGIRGISSLEFLREIHDRKKCGMVLCGTNVFREGLIGGPNARSMRQLWLRAYAPLQLPSVPSDKTMAEFASAFGLEPAQDKVVRVKYNSDAGESLTVEDNPLRLQRDIARTAGLGRWLSILQEASDQARANGGRMTWGRVILAHKMFTDMERAEE